jgi:hypothetical protein
MRLTSEFWVSAYLRRCEAAGAYPSLRKRGALEAGAIYIIVSDFAGVADLYIPAPQNYFAQYGSISSEQKSIDRCFIKRLVAQDMRIFPNPITDFLTKEEKFDSDLWIIDIEERARSAHLDATELMENPA